ncbi:Putative binding protein BMEII0691, partial [Durusdinium trenchii]
MDRVVLPWLENLKRLGVQANYRSVDHAAFKERIDTYDFDITIYVLPQRDYPGQEIREYFHSGSRQMSGGRNLAGINDPVVDALVDKVLSAKSLPDYRAAVHALDRVLLWRHYIIPHWYLDYHRLAWWDKFGRPDRAMHTRVMKFLPRLLMATLLALPLFSHAADTQTYHALSMYGDVKYPADFQRFDYVNPDAPKRGSLKLFQPGAGHALQKEIPKGVPAAGLTSYIWDTLTVRSLDEPFTEYGLLAESMEMPADRSWIVFTLREQARFADGEPVRADDVVFTFNALTTQGSPFYAAYYGSVTSAEALDERRVKFTFAEQNNRELPLIIGQLP